MTTSLRVRTIFVTALSATAMALTLTGNAFAAPPPNDNFPGTALVGPPPFANVAGTTVEATDQAGEPDHGGLGEAVNSIWYQWTAPTTQAIELDACDSEDFVAVRAYTGNPVSALTSTTDGLSDCSMTFLATGGINYTIAIDGLGFEGATALDVIPISPPANDPFASAVALPGAGPISVAGTTVSATRQLGEPNPLFSAGSVWYAWTPSGSGPATFDVCTSQGDPTLAVFSGATLNTLSTVTADDDAENPICTPNEFGTRVSFNAVAGTTFRIAVAALLTEQAGTFTLAGVVPPAPLAPVKPKKCKKGFKKVKRKGKVKCKRKKKKKKG